MSTYNKYAHASALDMAHILRLSAVPLLKGAGLESDACHPQGIAHAQRHYAQVGLGEWSDKCIAWIRLHATAFAELVCEACAGKGVVYPNWMAFGDDTPQRCDRCHGNGLRDNVRQSEWNVVAHMIGKPPIDDADGHTG